jgi:DNA invertase Pin-like site-specific DNA recombinase
MKTPRRIKACVYLRMSSDAQETSIPIQRKRLVELAEKEGYEVVEWYKDEGRSGSKDPEKRLDWMRLLYDAKHDAEWEVVLCFDRSRFSRLDSFEEAFAKQTLRECGKRLHTAIEGLADWESSNGRIMDTIHAEASNAYSVKLARAVLEGRLDAFLSGRYCLHMCPYGMARRVVDPQGETRLISRKESFHIPKGWSQTFVPGDPEEIETVRWIFHIFATQDVGYRWIARQLNAKGVPSASGKKWVTQTVGRLLTVAAYVGDSEFGRRKAGKFARVEGEKVIQRNFGRKTSVGKKGLVRQSTHEGIVDRAVWDAVQAKIKQRHESPVRRLSRGDGGFALKGVLTCGHCKKPLYGKRFGGAVHYFCRRASELGSECGCNQWSIRERAILPCLIGKLTAEIDLRLLELGSVKPPSPQQQVGNDATAALERKVAALDKKIRQGNERFLLAPVERTVQLQAIIGEWEVERAVLVEKLEQAKQSVPSMEGVFSEWQRWFDAANKELIHVQSSPEVGVQFKKGASFTPASFRETLRRFGCRATVWWKQRSARRWDVERVRFELGAKREGDEDLPTDHTYSSVVPVVKSPIDVVFSGKDLFLDSSYDDAVAAMAEMKDQGLTFEEIATRLNERGLKTHKGQPWKKCLVGLVFRTHRSGGPDRTLTATDQRRKQRPPDQVNS